MPKKCRDCQTLIDNRFIYCNPCRLKHRAEQILTNREKQKGKSKKPFIPKFDKPALEQKPPHKCKTNDCKEIVTGKTKYCHKCKLRRRRIQQNKYRNETKQIAEKVLRPTGLEWLDNFSDYAKSGLPYSEYQKREAQQQRCAT